MNLSRWDRQDFSSDNLSSGFRLDSPQQPYYMSSNGMQLSNLGSMQSFLNGSRQFEQHDSAHHVGNSSMANATLSNSGRPEDNSSSGKMFWNMYLHERYCRT